MQKQMSESERQLFLLGGHDLEMLTIRQQLDRTGIAYVDHQLRWDNARLSSYRKELEEASAKDWIVYGVELQEDIPKPPGYRAIDHHNSFAHLDSALEQVMALLGQPMDRYQQLVAANDKGYIPGMLEIAATQEEINLIRHADRKAQGITDEDESLAEKAVTNNCTKIGDLFVVKAFSSRFSPICDRLFPFRSLLVYTDEEWVYYGKGMENVKKFFEKEYLADNLFCGGGENGYVGAKCGVYSLEEIQKMVEHIKMIEK